MNISKLRTVLDKRNGIHRSAHFYVRILKPKGVNFSSYDLADLELMCEVSSLPGHHFDTMAIKPMGYGVSELRPHDSVFSPVRCDLFVDNSNYVLNFLHRWIGNIQNFSQNITTNSDDTKLKYYQLAYPTEYESSVEIHAIRPDRSEIIVYTLNGAYPGSVGDVSLSWGEHDSYSRIPVTFNYKTWSTKLLPYGAYSDPYTVNTSSTNPMGPR